MTKLMRPKGIMVITTAAIAAVLGVIALTQPAKARPRPLCGPTYQWSCSKSPTGPAVLFTGTVCEARAFEEETGTTCEPL